jgi:hypothetical protein
MLGLLLAGAGPTVTLGSSLVSACAKRRSATEASFKPVTENRANTARSGRTLLWEAIIG